MATLTKNTNETTPIKIYKGAVNFVKNNYLKSLEENLNSSFTDDTIVNKSINSTLATLSKLNPTKPISEIDNLVAELPNITNTDELKKTIALIHSKLKNLLKPKEDVVRKEVKTTKTIDKERLMLILFTLKFLNQKKFFKIFYALSILSYTKDKNVIARVHNLTDEELVDYALKNHKYISFDNPHLTHLYPYGGGKQKFMKFLNEHLKTTLNIDTFVDPFMGGMGSFYSGFRQIHQRGLNVVLNDLNPMIFNLNKNVQSKTKHKKMMQYISNITRLMFRKYDTYELNHEQYKEFHLRLLRLLNHIERKNTKSVLGSSILLFCLNNGFGGNYKPTKKGSYISPSTDEDKYVRFFNFVGKIEHYHFLYNSVNVKFENKDYKSIIKKYSTKSNTYTTFDPPYLNRLNMSVEEFEAEMSRLKKLEKQAKKKRKDESKPTREEIKYQKLQYKLLESCVFNYGLFGDSFDHEQLLKDLSLVKGELSYFNYPHPIIEKYATQYNLHIDLLGRKSTNGKVEAGEKIKEKFETFMTGKVNQSSQGNNSSYNPTDIKKVA